MKVITAPEKFESKEDDVLVFLGGGITNCPQWQDKLIDALGEKLPDNVVLFNPRRKDFDVTDPNASDVQVEWEHEWLNKADIFSMWFAPAVRGGTPSPQPICFYELGKYKQMMIDEFGDEAGDHLCISTDEDFVRAFDVQKQCALDGIDVTVGKLNDHANALYRLIKKYLTEE